jgi:hypothetical protein
VKAYEQKRRGTSSLKGGRSGIKARMASLCSVLEHGKRRSGDYGRVGGGKYKAYKNWIASFLGGVAEVMISYMPYKIVAGVHLVLCFMAGAGFVSGSNYMQEQAMIIRGLQGFSSAELLVLPLNVLTEVTI